MNTHTSHHDLVCEECGKRIGGCKCLASGKEKRLGGLCEDCKAKQSPTSSGKKFITLAIAVSGAYREMCRAGECYCPTVEEHERMLK